MALAKMLLILASFSPAGQSVNTFASISLSINIHILLTGVLHGALDQQ
jgi:hypothetical protein